MNKEELKTLLDALFPETIVDDTSTHTMLSRLPYDPKAGLGYSAKQTEGDKKIMDTVRRLDGSDKKTTTINNSELHRTLSRSTETHVNANSSLFNSTPKDPGTRLKHVTNPRSVSFLDKILRKIKN